MKMILITAMAGLLWLTTGCQSRNFSKNQVKVLEQNNDIVLSGKTGEIVGSKADNDKSKVKCVNCGFNEGALRQRMIMAVTDDPEGYDKDTIKRLKEHQIITISGETGEIVGSKKHKDKTKVECESCGFPKDSFRYRMIEASTD